MLVNLLESCMKSIRSDHMYKKVRYDPNQIFNKQISSFRKEGHILSQLKLLVYRQTITSMNGDRFEIKMFIGTL